MSDFEMTFEDAWNVISYSLMNNSKLFSDQEIKECFKKIESELSFYRFVYENLSEEERKNMKKLFNKSEN